MINSTKIVQAVAAAALAISWNAAHAQVLSDEGSAEADAFLDSFKELLEQQNSGSRRSASVPAIPSATNSGHGTVFTSLTYSNPRGGVDGGGGDGSAAVGFAIGDAATGVSLQFTANITGLDSPFAGDGYFTVQLSRQLDRFSNPTHIGFTVANVAGWGDSADNAETVSLQISQNIPGNIPIAWSAGIGSGVRSDKPVGDREGAFAGVGFGIADGLSVGASTNFDKINFGATYNIEQVPGLSISFSATDLTKRRGEVINSLTLGYSFSAF